ncbi:hypothetical protein IAU59_000933 [Kwoniella sp. CBS 9459]
MSLTTSWRPGSSALNRLIARRSPNPISRDRLGRVQTRSQRVRNRHTDAAKTQVRDTIVPPSVSSAFPDTTIDEALATQDPYKRITFHPPSYMIGRGKEIDKRFRLTQLWFDRAQDFEAHILPFWTLTLVCDQTVTTKHFAPNLADYIETPKRVQTGMGLTIAAVGPDHWASGYITPLNIRYLAKDAEDYLNLFPLVDTSSLPSGSARVYSNPVKRCEPFVSPDWNPSIAPKYALSPPRFTDNEVERIISLQAQTTDYWDDVWNPKGIKVFAVPTYKLMYKVVLDRGVGILDAQSPISAFNTMAINWLRGGIRPADDFLWNTVGIWKRPRTFDRSSDWDGLDSQAFHPESKLNTLFSTIHDAMKRRGPMTPEMWEDERILPDFGLDTKTNVQTLLEWVRGTITGIDERPEPRFPLKARSGSTGQPSIFASRTRPQPAKTKQAAPSATSSNTSASPSSAATTSASEPPPRDERRTSRYGTSSVDKRRAYIRARARLAEENVLKSSYLNNGSLLLKYPRVLPDPKGFYRRLGLYEPGREFLDNRSRATADEKIQDQYFTYSLETHPDRPGGSDVDFIAVKEANEALETLEKRIAYYKRSS